MSLLDGLLTALMIGAVFLMAHSFAHYINRGD